MAVSPRAEPAPRRPRAPHAGRGRAARPRRAPELGRPARACERRRRARGARRAPRRPRGDRAAGRGSSSPSRCTRACCSARRPLPIDLRLAEHERARARGPPRDAARLRRRPAPCLAVHTSGTTSAPKLVELTWGNVEANALGSALALGFDRDERWLCPLPLTHVGGLMVLLRSLVYGTAAQLLPAPFDPAAADRALIEEGVTLASLVPTLLARMLDAGLARPPRLRAVLLGGAPSDPALLERARAAGVPVAQTYGLTEACSQVCTSAPGEPETAGCAAAAGSRCALEPDGEILVEGPTVAGGGTLRTGDLGRLDAARAPDRDRPQVRHDRLRRRERRAGGGRGRAARAPRRGRRRRLRAPGPRVGRGGRRARRAARRRRPRSRRSCRRSAASGSPASRCPRPSSWRASCRARSSGKLLRRERAGVSATTGDREPCAAGAPGARGPAGRPTARRDAPRDDARLDLDGRGDRAAARPHGARAGRGPGRHRLPRRRADRSRAAS